MQKNIAAAVTEIVRPYVEAEGCDLWDVEYLKESSKQILRITIERKDGTDTDIDDCERVHRAIDPVLDEADPIPVQYYLEVSSPGLERELRTPAHIRAFLGQKVVAKFYAPIDGKKEITDTLDDFDEEKNTVTIGGKQLERSKIAVLYVYYEF